MVFADKFNNYFKTGKMDDMLLGMYIADCYGSNAFCFHKAATIMAVSNDHAEIPTEAPKKPVLTL